MRDRAVRSVRPPRLVGAHPALGRDVAAVADQTAHLRHAAERALTRFGRSIADRQIVQRHLFTAAAGVTAQTAVVSRLSASLARGGGVAAERVLAAQFLPESRLAVEGAFEALDADPRGAREAARVTRQAGGYPLR